MPQITVIGAVLDTRCLTVYDSTGKSYEIPHTRPYFERLVNKLIPLIEQGKTYTMDIDDPVPDDHDPNFHDFQERNTLGIKFKRVARSILGALFHPKAAGEEAAIANGTYGLIPASDDGSTEVAKQEEAARQIIAAAKPITAKTSVKPTEQEAIVATLGDAVIPEADKLKSYLANARKLNDYRGVQNLILRLSAMIGERKHSIMDVLQFLDKGDLPITDRGDILAYKRLCSQGTENYVDPHSMKVFQREGDFVCMPVKNVDQSRAQACSYGLHVGRRDYMGSFSGDSLFLVQIAPEDLIAVPHGDPNKVRVCGYHLLTKMSQEMAQKVYNRQPFAADSEGAKLLGRAVAGQFGAPKRIVQIMNERTKELKVDDAPEGFIGQTVNQLPDGVMGTANITAEQIGNREIINIEPPVEKVQKDEPALPQSKLVNRVQNAISKANQVKEKQAAKEAKAAAPKPVKAKEPTRQERVAEMFTTFQRATGNDKILAAQSLVGFKKKAKVSWEALGIDEQGYIDDIIRVSEKVMQAEAAQPVGNKSERQTKAAELLAIYQDHSNDTQTRHQAANDLVALKKKAKIGWDRLGIREIDAKTVTEFAASTPLVQSAKPKATKKIPQQKQFELAKTVVSPKLAEKIDLSTVPSQMEQEQEAINEARAKTPNQEHARLLFEQKNWNVLKAFKQARRKSWANLGFSLPEEQEIKKHI